MEGLSMVTNTERLSCWMIISNEEIKNNINSAPQFVFNAEKRMMELNNSVCSFIWFLNGKVYKCISLIK